MSIKWRLTGFFILIAGLSLLLFWVGESAFMGSMGIIVDPWVVILALLIPGGAGYFYFLRLSQRLEKLVQATKYIAQGNFERISFLDSNDELGKIAGELNSISRQVEIVVKKGSQEANKMEAILTGMQEGVVALDQVGRIVLVNRAAEKIFNRRQEEVKLKYLIALVEHQELNNLVCEGLAGEPAGKTEFTLDQRILEVQVSPILVKEGHSRGAVIVCHDITELRRLEQVRTEFVANVSHELRTPLTSIKGFAETLLDGAAEVPSFRERFLKIIQAETLRLQRLIEDLLTLSNIENRNNRRIDQSRGQSFIQDAYEKIRPIIESYAEAKAISLEIDLAADLPAVALGGDLLSQVLLNLLENAVKYTSEGSVWLHGKLVGRQVRLEFGDTGSGISEGSLPRIFERFYRVDKARSREQGGTGLGLSIVKHILEGCQGKIEVVSQLGVGTVFTCDLPCV
ncbi:MAG: HAMP domain-containing sensor histidine kinase [Desulfitobacteriaceae bacterium]